MNKRRKHNKNTAVMAIVLLLSITGSVILFNRNYDTSQTQSVTDPETLDAVNPSSPVEKKDKVDEKTTDSTKKPTVSNSTSNEGDVVNKKTVVSVVIVDASQYGTEVEVRAFIPNYYQEGVCTFTFTLGDIAIIKQSTATADASSTICTNIVVPSAEFPQSGTWTLKIDYSSADAAGSSEIREIIIS